IVGVNYQPTGRMEAQRRTYMEKCLSCSGFNVLDIGANTGYFTFSALENSAAHVTVFEGNKHHAEFLNVAARHLKLDQRLEVRDRYFDFNETQNKRFNLI